MAELAPVERLRDRIESLIASEPTLEVAETVGVLHMIAYKICKGAYLDYAYLEGDNSD